MSGMTAKDWFRFFAVLGGTWAVVRLIDGPVDMDGFLLMAVLASMTTLVSVIREQKA